jgi:hypothetical protein
VKHVLGIFNNVEENWTEYQETNELWDGSVSQSKMASAKNTANGDTL